MLSFKGEHINGSPHLHCYFFENLKNKEKLKLKYFQFQFQEK